jgi:hypothetical protein
LQVALLPKLTAIERELAALRTEVAEGNQALRAESIENYQGLRAEMRAESKAGEGFLIRSSRCRVPIPAFYCLPIR